MLWKMEMDRMAELSLTSATKYLFPIGIDALACQIRRDNFVQLNSKYFLVDSST